MTQLQLARNAWHNYNYTECITHSQPNSNTRHTQTRHGSSTMFCNDEQDLLLPCNNLPHASFIPLRVQCLELTQTQTTSTNRWSTNWHKHKQHQQIDDQQIDTNTTTITIISLYHIAPNLFHLVKVGSACLWGLLSGPLGPIPWRHKAITNTYTDTYIHWQYIEATHCSHMKNSTSSVFPRLLS